jgi:hypothetical protein
MANLKADMMLDNGTKDIHAAGDASTNALVTIDRNIHQINAGNHFFVHDVADLAINEVYDVQWTTPNTAEWAHFTFVINCKSETEWYIYEGVTIGTAGTAITPRNNNRNSANTSSATIAGILNTSVVNANADTATAGATQLAHGIVGAGKTGGVEERDVKIVLKQNTIYCFRGIANAAGYLNFLMEWHEHTDIS